jgi:HSP20 family protein
MDRLFEDSVITPKSIGAMPKIDIKETKDSIVVKAELPGIEEDKVDVEIMDNVMTISGEKAEEKVEEGEGYHYKESHTGTFQRSFSLPADVKAEKAEADMKDGILTIKVPKIEPKKAKKVSIKSKSKK